MKKSFLKKEWITVMEWKKYGKSNGRRPLSGSKGVLAQS